MSKKTVPRTDFGAIYVLDIKRYGRYLDIDFLCLKGQNIIVLSYYVH